MSLQAIGAVAGVGAGGLLVVLTVLYVAHAREVERLREWAGHAPERRRRPRPRGRRGRDRDGRR
jgi:hypothetical protein